MSRLRHPLKTKARSRRTPPQPFSNCLLTEPAGEVIELHLTGLPEKTTWPGT